MEITEVRIKLMEDGGERLQAFCSITFDNCFVVRDLKIIEGANGPFVAMPSRKLTMHCPKCSCKNHLRAQHCNQCGARLPDDRVIKEQDGRAKLYADIAHPINSSCREMIQDRVIEEFHRERERAKEPGYVSRYEDLDGDDFLDETRDVSRDDSSDERREQSRVDKQARPHARQKPQGPHQTPAQKPSRKSDSTSQRPSSFGEGIFED